MAMDGAVINLLPPELLEHIFVDVVLGTATDGSVARGLADLGAAARVCQTWAALIAAEDFAGWLMLLASLHRRCRLPLKLPWRRVIAADPDGRARRYRSMLRRVRADALLLLVPAGRDHLVRVRLDRALKSPKDNTSIYLKVYNHLPFPVTWHWKDTGGKEIVYPVHPTARAPMTEPDWDDPIWKSSRPLGSCKALPQTPPLGDGDICHFQQTYNHHAWYVRRESDGAFLGGFYALADATIHVHPWCFADNAFGIEDGDEAHVPELDAEKFARYWAEGGGVDSGSNSEESEESDGSDEG